MLLLLLQLLLILIETVTGPFLRSVQQMGSLNLGVVGIFFVAVVVAVFVAVVVHVYRNSNRACAEVSNKNGVIQHC